MTELERKIQAKIPGEDTGIAVKRSLCAICSPGHHCGVDCYVKDGKIIRVEGTPEHPYNHGKLCTKGSSLRNYVYREDRIKTPLRRVGRRGEGKFEPISWDEAYQIIAENLNRVKEQYSAYSVLQVVPPHSPPPGPRVWQCELWNGRQHLYDRQVPGG